MQSTVTSNEMTGYLLIHQAHTIKVNAVKDEQAHFGVLEGSFL